jgi:putative salt-induced outer membrane protein YdiY
MKPAILLAAVTYAVISIIPHTVSAQAKDELIDSITDDSPLIPPPPRARLCSCPGDPPPEKKDYELGISFGFNLTQGNISTRLLTGGLDAALEKDKNIYKFSLFAAEGEQEREITQRYARTNLSYDRLLTKKFYIGAGTSFLADDIADVDYRSISNIGAGYFFLKEDDIKLSFETGPAYVFEKQGSVKDNYAAVRIANNFTWKFTETGSFFQRAEFIVNTENAEDFLIIARAGIQAALNSMLSLVFSVEDRFDNSPAEDTKRNDVIITSSLKVNF